MHLWKDYNLPLYFRPYFQFPLVTEFDVVKTEEGFHIKASKITSKRVFVEDIPSLCNLDPYTKEAMIGVEVEKAEAMKAAMKKGGSGPGVDKTIEKALFDYEHDG